MKPYACIASCLGWLLASACTPSASLPVDPASLPEFLGDIPNMQSAISPGDNFVTRRGSQLFDGPHTYRALGSNRFDLAAGAHAMACRRSPDADTLRARQLGTLTQLRQTGGSVVRLWAFQSLAGPTGDDFSHLDSLIETAHEVGISLILVLENHYAECSATDTPAREVDWYAGGFARPYGGYALSFDAYVDKIVRRYAQEPAILMWQVMNEAQAPGQPETVRDFLAHITSIIRRHDKSHLICGGGAMDCGSPQGAHEYEVMAQVPHIDVLDVHDFGTERTPWPSCLAQAKQVADRQQLTLMVGESGIEQDPQMPARRAYHMHRKISAAAAQGVGIYLVWSMNTDPQYPDRFDVLRGDPMIRVLQSQAADAFGMADDQDWLGASPELIDWPESDSFSDD